MLMRVRAERQSHSASPHVGPQYPRPPQEVAFGGAFAAAPNIWQNILCGSEPCSTFQDAHEPRFAGSVLAEYDRYPRCEVNLRSFLYCVYPSADGEGLQSHGFERLGVNLAIVELRNVHRRLSGGARAPDSAARPDAMGSRVES